MIAPLNTDLRDKKVGMYAQATKAVYMCARTKVKSGTRVLDFGSYSALIIPLVFSNKNGGK